MRRWVGWLLLAALVCVCGGAAAATPAATCSLNSKLSDFSQTIATTGQTAMAPMTMVLPPDGNAWMVFHQPLQNAAGTVGAAANLFLIYETDAPQGSGITTLNLPITSIAPDGSSVPAGFTATDSVQIQFKITPQLLPLWGNRHFTIIECSATGQFSAWGHVVAPVSNPDVDYAISTLVILIIYVLALLAVYGLRKRTSALDTHLSDTYPALFRAKKLDLKDLWNPIYLTEDAFHRASVQKLQVLLFSFLVAWLLLSLVLRTGTLADLSPTVVGLMGISGVGAATSHIAYQQKTRLSFVNWAWLQKKQVLVTPGENELPTPQWKDLVMTSREFDIYKLQTIIFSITVAIAMLIAGATSLSSFSVPDSLLGLLGLSQVVYVGGVLVQPPAVGDLDDALTKLRQAGETVATAKLRKTDTGTDGKLMNPPLPPDQEPGANAQRQYDDMAKDVFPMIESALEVQANLDNLLKAYPDPAPPAA